MSAKRIRTTTDVTPRLPQAAKKNSGPRAAKPIDPNQLLYSRAQVCTMLGGVHPATVARLEDAGKLRAVRLSPEKENCRVYYRREDVLALIDGLTPA